MKQCPYCGHSNNDNATECRKCNGQLVAQQGTVYKSLWVGAERAAAIRSKALSALVLGLLMKVYWGGYGPWPVVDDPRLLSLRDLLEPWLIFGGVILYVIGWILNWV